MLDGPAGMRCRLMLLLFNLLGFLPLVAFITYATSNGPPSAGRWIAAYRFASVLALVHVGVALMLRGPANRVALGANVYLLVGGGLAWLSKPALRLFGGELRECGVLLCIFAVGAAATVFSRSGFTGVAHPDAQRVRRDSLILLLVTAAAALCADRFRGDRLLGGFLPIVVVIVANQMLARGLLPRRRSP